MLDQFEPDSAEWHAWRKLGIGSSDAAVIYAGIDGKSHFGGDWQSLYLDKAEGIAKSFSPWAIKAMQRGKDLEPRAREIYERRQGHPFPPEYGVHKEHPYIRASFDGINHDLKRVLEIKCPGQKDLLEALAGRIPEKYIPQCQWLMMVSGYEDLDYVTFDGTDIIVIPLKADPSIQHHLLLGAKEFWSYVEAKTPPPQKEKISINPVLLSLLDQWKDLHAQYRQIDEELNRLKIKIKELASDGTTLCGNYKIQHVVKRGNVEYQKIPELFGVDLEKYRKNSITAFTISNVGDEK